MKPWTNPLDEALWPREWRRVCRWLGSARGLAASGAALLGLAFVIAPSLIVDFAGWGALERLRQVPGAWFFLPSMALQAFAFVLAAMRSGQVLQKEFHGRQLEHFLLAFPDAARTLWTVLATGLVQAGLLCACAVPVLLVCTFGKAAVPAAVFVATFAQLAAFTFFASALGTAYFFAIHRLLPKLPRTVLTSSGLVAVGGWLLLEASCARAHATGTGTDSVVRLAFIVALVALWQLVAGGWRALARAVRMSTLSEWGVLVAGTTSVILALALTPPEVFVAGRIKLWPLFLTPWPYTIAPALNWEPLAQYVFGEPTPLPSLVAALCLLYVVAGLGVLEVAIRSYQKLWRNPEPIFDRPIGDEDAKQTTERETYWPGLRNAVWTLDLRGRLRNRDTATFMTFTAGVTALAGFLPLLSGLEVLSDPLRAAEVARGVFGYLVLTETALVTFLIPGMASEVIGLEREHKTVELLLATALRPREILVGKLLGVTSYLMLLVSPSLPLFAFCCLLHGATVSQTLLAYAVMLVAALVWGALGVTISATTRELIVAKYLAYGAVLTTAALPGSPMWMAFFLGNPTGGAGPSGMGEIAIFGLAWLSCAGLVLSVAWSGACFRLGNRWGAEG